MRARLGFSSCPNDTFMFDALVAGRVTASGVEFEVVMDDISGLNQRALGPICGALEVTKLSVSAWARAIDRYAGLQTGAALGRGCGPLVVTRGAHTWAGLRGLAGKRIAVPGLETTAYLLLRSFGPARFEPVVMRFDEVMPAVASGACDAGLIIHESRFTYREHGLRELADLGVLWESETGHPLPLGIIAARRDLPEGVAGTVQSALGSSVQAAWDHPEHSEPYIKAHAAEMDAQVCRQHIALYVNDFSADLGEAGRAAVEAFVTRGRALGLLPSSDAVLWAT